MSIYESLVQRINLPDDELRKRAEQNDFPSCQAYIDSLHRKLDFYRPRKTVAQAQASLDAARQNPKYAFEYYNRVYRDCCKSIKDMLQRLEDGVETAKKYSAYTPEEISRRERHGLRVSG